MKNRLAELLNQEQEEKGNPIYGKPKWLFEGMTKDEIRNGYEEVQRELNGENNE